MASQILYLWRGTDSLGGWRQVAVPVHFLFPVPNFEWTRRAVLIQIRGVAEAVATVAEGETRR